MVVVLRDGLPGLGSDASTRASFIGSHTVPWRLGWLTWNLAAISLVAFYIALKRDTCSDHGLLPRLAVLCAVAGLAADLSAEALMMGLEPGLPVHVFPLVERVSLLLTGYLANGLYSLGGALLTVSWRGIPRHLLTLAIPLWGAGFLLSATTMLDWPSGAVVAAGFTMFLFVVWTLRVGRWASTRTY